MMERLSHAADALLRIEDEVSAVHGMTVGVFDGPQPSFDDIQDLVLSRVPQVPRYRQRLVEVPLSFERPVWVDDPHFSIDFHVRNTALPERREIDALSALVSRLQSQRIDRSKPLWELWVVSNLRDGHWALISKVHYAMIDGISGTDLFGLLLDDAPVADIDDLYRPKPLPTPSSLIPAALVDRAFDPVDTIRALTDVALLPMRTVQRSVAALRPAEGALRTEIGPHRRWHRCQVPLETATRVSELHDCSTSDVVLAAITGGIRHWLEARGEEIPSWLTAMIPLAIASENTGYNSEIAATTARLPLGIADPIDRLDTITAQTALTARSAGAVAAHALSRENQFSSPTVMALGVGAALQETHRSRRIDTVAVNVPGPTMAQHVLGCELLKVYPVIPLAGQVPVAVGVLSYNDDLSFGITGDYDSAPELSILADGIRESLEALAAAPARA